MSFDPSSAASTKGELDTVPLPPPLPPGEEALLWHGVSQQDEAAKQALALHYLPLARRMAASAFGGRYGASLEFDDFFQYALIGLMEAIERFEPDKGISFPTFGGYRIKGAILNGVEKLTEQQQQHQARKRILAERTNTLNASPNKSRNFDELFTELASIAIGLAIGCILEGSGLYRAEEDEQSQENAYARYELKQIREQISALVETLPEKERLIIKLHYFHGVKFEEIAKEMEYSKGRISQLHHSALTALRTKYEQIDTIDKKF